MPLPLPMACRMNRLSRLLRLSLLASSAAVSLTLADASNAQEIAAPAPGVQRVADPGRSVASSDDSSAIVVNPANLTFMPGTELRWNWVRTAPDAAASARGHSFALASSLPFGIATGVRLDFLRPPSRSIDPYRNPYAWLSWGLSFGSKTSALGMSIAHVYSDDRQVGGPTSLTLGWTGRPSRFLSLAAVAHDLNAPSNSLGAHIDRSYTAGGVLRPIGTPALEVGVEGRYFSSPEKWVPRGVLGVQVPYVGRLRGDFAVLPSTHDAPREYVASAMLDLTLPHLVLSGGGIWGGAVGGRDGAGFVTGVAVQSWRDPGVPALSHAVRVRIENTPGNRRHVKLLRKLWAMSSDPEVAAVVFHLKTEPASSLAHAHELADAIDLLRARGKKVLCHLEAEGGRALYVCAHADRTVVNPAGGLHFSGMRAQYTYLGGMLDKLGVRAEFVRIGDYKSAPEQFTNKGPSPAADEAHAQNLREVDQLFISDVARLRRIDPSALRASIALGPYTAPEALRAGLVDGYAYDDELRRVVYESLGGRSVALDDDWEAIADRSFGKAPGVAVVYLEGQMIDGQSRKIPLLGTQLAGSYTVAKALRSARENPAIRAVVFRIESPGGSSMAADVIWREALLTARAKPLIVSMGTVAASGGYYAAAPARLIYATPFTTTGSIGIFYGKADIAQLLTKIGVNVHTLKTAPHADGESIFRPFTEEERRVLGDKVKQFYDVFIDRVAQGRNMSPEQVHAVARGRVWTGSQAATHKLVDRIGGLRQALSEARALAGLGDDSPILELPVPQTSLLDVVASYAGVQSNDQALLDAFSPHVVSVLQPLAPFLVFTPDQPMALMEIADLP